MSSHRTHRTLVALVFVAAIVTPRETAHAWPSPWIKTYAGEIPVDDFVKAWGVSAARASAYYAKNDVVSVWLIESSAPANILWPGERARFTFQFTNLTDERVSLSGRGVIIKFGVHTKEGVAKIGIHKIADAGSMPVSLTIEPKGYRDVTLDVPIPEKLGGYALLFDFPGHDRLFGANCVRTFKADVQRRRFHRFTMDAGPVSVLSRLGAAPNRMGIGYFPTTGNRYAQYYAECSAKLAELNEADLPVTLEFGCGSNRGPEQPLGRDRPHLDGEGNMKGGKTDIAWLPSYDEDFRGFVKRFCVDHGWPNGPVNGVMLWNEPWEGLSISGWGADMPRYREIYTAMALGVEDARREAGVKVLIGGCDSSANTFDKLFGDGTDDMMKWLDFMSIHYQGMSPASTIKKFVNRTLNEGRVLIWDTESWVANSEDRVSAVIPTNYATGHDRCVGVQSDNVAYSERWIDVRTPAGSQKRHIVQPWPVAAGIGAVQHMVGHRTFKQVVFKSGLPWVYEFDGIGNADDGTVVVIGDLGPSFGGNNVLFRTVRGLAEVKHEAQLRRRLEALPDEALEERAKLRKGIDELEPLQGATMTIDATGARFNLYDVYGNPVPARDGTIVVPLDARGFYLRGDGSAGSFAALLGAVRAARIDGFEPLQAVCRDFKEAVGARPSTKLELTNILNRPVTGRLTIDVAGLEVEYPRELAFEPHETKTIDMRVAGGAASADNRYPLVLTFDAGPDGTAEHRETLHVNVISRRTITVDGDLSDWKGALPQSMSDAGDSAPTMMEAAWLPFKKFDEGVKKGFATGYLAYDETNFYFAAKVADTTPDGGTMRFETRDDDQFYYPEVCYIEASAAAQDASNFSVRWTGYVRAGGAGEYTFSTLSDDGIRVWVDGVQLVDNWTGHGDTWDSGRVKLEAGTLYPIKVEFYQGGGGATLQLCWEGPSIERIVVPANALFQDANGDASGLSATYFRGTDLKHVAQRRIDKTIDYKDWPGDVGAPSFGGPLPSKKIPLKWPEGVRRYSYRRYPVLPSGNAPNFDNVQIAFNVLGQDRKTMYPHPPGTMDKFTTYHCSDYEYALNKVHQKYGGGVEIWRLRYPGMPTKHFYPRQAPSPLDGPVRDGSLVVKQGDTTRIVECAIPWTELPDVKTRLDAGQVVKFSYRVNDNAGLGCLELSRKRSVARSNQSFQVDWKEHWANELEFAFEGTAGTAPVARVVEFDEVLPVEAGGCEPPADRTSAWPWLIAAALVVAVCGVVARRVVKAKA